MKYHRVCISINGYAVVPGDTDAEIAANVQTLNKTDFDWETVDSNVLSDYELVEDCGPNGESLS